MLQLEAIESEDKDLPLRRGIEPGVDVVLFGTGEADHLRANIASLLALPLADRLTLTKMFGHLSGGGLDPPRGVSSP